ncbi:MAG: hypothetical protein U9R32_06995 [Bacteroidota bacterium]|nr:hypothetical protein [Bacteroidota bacterium]
MIITIILHWIGTHGYEGQSYLKDVAVYMKCENNIWTPITEISGYTRAGGKDIDVDNSNLPHTVWRQKHPSGDPAEDSTMYRYFNGNNWTIPELIVEDPREQQIIIDNYNKPNIFDVEKTEEGSILIHYYKNQDYWVGYIIDNSEWNVLHSVVHNKNNKLYAAYIKPLSSANSNIAMSVSKIITHNNLIAYTLKTKIYPNPFN